MALRFASPALAVLALSAPCVLASPSARADEAFLCGPDTVVYVKPDELEHKKRTDPCIARYFGTTVESAATEAGPGAKAAAATNPAKPANIALKSLQAPEASERVTPPPFERSASLQLPMPQAGTDYRNVKVINATSPADQWFKHTR